MADQSSSQDHGSHSAKGPCPDTRFPFNGEPHTVFLKNVVSGDNIEVGDFSYYHDPENARAFQEKCVRYHFDFLGDVLRIGKFCALATGVEFIMNGATHAMNGLSTYPFHIFQNGWEQDYDLSIFPAQSKGDTVVGHDVWIGTQATILPGVTIGSGAIIGAKAVVASDVPPYAIVVGNPGRVIRLRFLQETIDRLLKIAWWDWSPEKITRHLHLIRGADVDALEAVHSSPVP